MKKNKKTIIYTITGVGLGSIVISGCSLIATTVIQNKNSITNNTITTENTNQQYKFDNKVFNSKLDAYNYAKQQTSTKMVDATNVQLYSININNAQYLFKSQPEIDNFINNQIQVINTQTNNKYDILDPADNSIPLQKLNEYNININNGKPYDNPVTTIYQTSNDTFITADTPEEQERAIYDAKDSYFTPHQMFYFNGIYFKTTQDLERYLRDVYKEIAINQSVDNLSTYRKIRSLNENYVSQPINFASSNTKAPLQVSNFLYDNSNQFIRLANSGTDQKDSFIKYDERNPEKINTAMNAAGVDIADLPIIKRFDNDSRNLFIVDLKAEDQNNLYGPYFIRTTANMESITDPEAWSESSDSPEVIAQSCAIDLLTGLIESLQLDPSWDPVNKAYGLDYKNDLLPENSFFQFANEYDILAKQYPNTKEGIEAASNRDNLINLEQNMLRALKKINGPNGRSLYDSLMLINSTLVHTKSYCSTYSMPVLYNYLIDNLVKSYADPITINYVQDYFTTIANEMQKLLETNLGEDLLVDYDYMNETNREERRKHKFNFAEFFQINQFNANPINLGVKLSGNQFFRHYKGILAAGKLIMIAKSLNRNQLSDPTYQCDFDKDVYNLVKDGAGGSLVNGKEDIRKTFENKVLEVIKPKKQEENATTANEPTIPVMISYREQLETLFNNWKADRLAILNLINDKKADCIEESRKDGDNTAEKAVKCLDALSDYYKTIDASDAISNLVDASDKRRNKDKDESEATGITFRTKQKIKFTKTLKSELEIEKEYNKKTLDLFAENKKTSWDDNFSSKAELNEVTQKWKKEIEMKNSKEAALELETINECHETFDNQKGDKEEKKELVNKIVKGVTGIFGGILETVGNAIRTTKQGNWLKEPQRSEDLASGIMSGLSSICSAIGDLPLPPPGGAIAKAVAFGFDLIAQAIGKAEQKIYEYTVQSQGENSIKYYWDGGLTMNRFWGLWKEDVTTINDMKMSDPIKIIDSEDKDYYYFNGTKYDDPSIAKIDAIKYVIENINSLSNGKTSKYSMVYSLQKDPANLVYYDPTRSTQNKITKEPNTFSSIWSNPNNIINSGVRPTITTPVDLTEYVIKHAEDSIKPNANPNDMSNFLTNCEGDIYMNGIPMSQDKFNDEIKDIVNTIKPSYVAKVPDKYNSLPASYTGERNRKPLPARQQSKFHAPYPYYEPSKSKFQSLVIGADEKGQLIYADPTINGQYTTFNVNSAIKQDQELIIINQNLKIEESVISEERYLDSMKKQFFGRFDVNSKQVLKSMTIEHQRYSQFEESTRNIALYKVEIIPTQPKYFISSSDAYKYIINVCNNGNTGFRISPFAKQMMVFKNQQGQNIYFNSSNDFVSWFNQNAIPIKTGGNQ